MAFLSAAEAHVAGVAVRRLQRAVAIEAAGLRHGCAPKSYTRGLVAIRHLFLGVRVCRRQRESEEIVTSFKQAVQMIQEHQKTLKRVASL